MKKKLTLLVVLAAILSLSSCILIVDDNEGSLSVTNYTGYSINKICIGDDIPENYFANGDYNYERHMRTFWKGGSIRRNEHKTLDLEAGKYVVSVETSLSPYGYYCYGVEIEPGAKTKLAFAYLNGNLELYETY